MSWFVTMLLSGMLFAIGWRFGAEVYEWLRAFVTEAPEGIRKIREYNRTKKYRRRHKKYITTRR